MTTASAPAKVILLGEHTALYDNPVLVTSLDIRAYTSVKKRDDDELYITAPKLGIDKSSSVRRHMRGTELVRKAVELVGGGGFDIEITSDIPISSGMGSSAAIAASLIKALQAELGRKASVREVAEAAWECENLVHSKSSGVDPFAVSYGGLSIYQSGKIKRLGREGFPALVIAHSGVDSDTWEIVEHMDRIKYREPERFDAFLKLSKDLVEDGKKAIEGGDWDTLGRLMNENHEVLKDMKVSCKELDALVEAAVGSGALGAKLSGAGRGGVLIALVDDYSKWSVSKTLSRMGGKILKTEISEEGVRLE